MLDDGLGLKSRIYGRSSMRKLYSEECHRKLSIICDESDDDVTDQNINGLNGDINVLKCLNSEFKELNRYSSKVFMRSSQRVLHPNIDKVAGIFAVDWTNIMLGTVPKIQDCIIRRDEASMVISECRSLGIPIKIDSYNSLLIAEYDHMYIPSSEDAPLGALLNECFERVRSFYSAHENEILSWIFQSGILISVSTLLSSRESTLKLKMSNVLAAILLKAGALALCDVSKMSLNTMMNLCLCYMKYSLDANNVVCDRNSITPFNGSPRFQNKALAAATADIRDATNRLLRSSRKEHTSFHKEQKKIAKQSIEEAEFSYVLHVRNTNNTLSDLSFSQSKNKNASLKLNCNSRNINSSVEESEFIVLEWVPTTLSKVKIDESLFNMEGKNITTSTFNHLTKNQPRLSTCSTASDLRSELFSTDHLLKGDFNKDDICHSENDDNNIFTTDSFHSGPRLSFDKIGVNEKCNLSNNDTKPNTKNTLSDLPSSKSIFSRVVSSTTPTEALEISCSDFSDSNIWERDDGIQTQDCKNYFSSSQHVKRETGDDSRSEDEASSSSSSSAWINSNSHENLTCRVGEFYFHKYAELEEFADQFLHDIHNHEDNRKNGCIECESGDVHSDSDNDADDEFNEFPDNLFSLPHFTIEDTPAMSISSVKSFKNDEGDFLKYNLADVAKNDNNKTPSVLKKLSSPCSSSIVSSSWVIYTEISEDLSSNNPLLLAVANEPSSNSRQNLTGISSVNEDCMILSDGQLVPKLNSSNSIISNQKVDKEDLITKCNKNNNMNIITNSTRKESNNNITHLSQNNVISFNQTHHLSDYYPRHIDENDDVLAIELHSSFSSAKSEREEDNNPNFLNFNDYTDKCTHIYNNNPPNYFFNGASGVDTRSISLLGTPPSTPQIQNKRMISSPSSPVFSPPSSLSSILSNYNKIAEISNDQKKIVVMDDESQIFSDTNEKTLSLTLISEDDDELELDHPYINEKFMNFVEKSDSSDGFCHISEIYFQEIDKEIEEPPK